MRLLRWDGQDKVTFSLTDDLDTVPRYAILSHTWGADSDEVTFDDLKNDGLGQHKAGFKKLQFCGESAKRDGIEYFWVDTCCIDKRNHVELSEAINSMFRWYKNAERCYVYLSDVCAMVNDSGNTEAQHEWETSFRRSRWFTRGWTLQELLAPKVVQFFSREGIFLGDKQTLSHLIHAITNIPIMALDGVELDQFSIDERIRWTRNRQTKKIEDRAYCLLGIFNVHMPLIYGEGEHAFSRLRKEISDRWGGNVAPHLGNADQSVQFGSQESTSSSDRIDTSGKRALETNQMMSRLHFGETRPAKRARAFHHMPGAPLNDASQHRNLFEGAASTQNSTQDLDHTSRKNLVSVTDGEVLLKSLLFDRFDFRVNNVKRPLSSTCQWLFRDPQFQLWYSNARPDEHNSFFWIRGKPGCGKSTLMKAALEWIQTQKGKENTPRTMVPYFFNARALNSLEKSRLGLYRTVVHHLVSLYPTIQGLFVTRFALKEPGSRDDEWTIEELEGFLEEIVESNQLFELYLFVDALDEAEHDDDVRQMISFLIRLSDRDISTNGNEGCKFRICLSSRHYPYIKIGRGLSVIVEDRLEHKQDIEKYVNKQLTCDIGPEKDDLQAKILGRSANVFLWVVLVVEILNKLDDRGASFSDMKARLDTIPDDLNQLFSEILTKDRSGIEETMRLFQWMAFRMRPLEPAELYVAVELSKSPHDAISPSPAHIVVPPPDRLARYILNYSRGLVDIAGAATQRPVVQFIHETVREFLLGRSGLGSMMSIPGMNLAGFSHETLRTACLRRIQGVALPKKHEEYCRNNHGDNHPLENFMAHMRVDFPFLDYAILHAFSHAENAQLHNISQESFIQSQIDAVGLWKGSYRHWWNVLNCYEKAEPNMSLIHVMLQQRYSTLIPLLLETPNIANATCRTHGSVLYMASLQGDLRVAEMLLDRGAKVNTEEGRYGNALQAAVACGYESIAKMLLNAGADVNAQGGHYGNVLQAAAYNGRLNVVQLLLDRGADVNAQGGHYGNALQTALACGHNDIAEALMSSGAVVNAQGGHYGNGLQAALVCGHRKIVRILINKGADVNAQGGYYGNALQAAAYEGHHDIVKVLLDIGANVNAQGGCYGNALQAAAYKGHDDVVKTLLDSGADVNAQGGIYGTALQAAAMTDQGRTVPLLIDRGADITIQGGHCGSALQAAARHGHERAVQELLVRGADVNAQEGYYGTALHVAALYGHQIICRILLDRGAVIDAEGGYYGTALQAASRHGHAEVVQLLLDRHANVNAQGGHYGNALRAAMKHRRKRIVAKLLDRGAVKSPSE